MKISIPKPLKTVRAPKVRTPWLTGRATKWRVAGDWQIIVNDVPYTVPDWYVFNGSSIPWFLWWLFPPTYDPAWEASCFHDYCYSHLYTEVNKAFADLVFKEVMLKQGAKPWVANIFYLAVTKFGKGGW